MPMPRGSPSAAAVALLLAACGSPQVQEDANAGAAAPAAARVPATPPDAPAPKATEPRTTPWSPTGYALNGTEPFWGGSVTGTTIRYMTPQDQFGDVVETRLAIGADRETYSGSWRGSPFVLSLSQRPCSDGMSDRRYAFTAELRARGETRRGCADRQ
jgi:uncharacterized membrane protein